MRALLCERYGPPEELVLATIPRPRPGDDEVLIEVEAAAVNFPDVLFVADQYQVSIPPPFVPGSEFAGTVVEVGSAVHDWHPGERAFGSVMAGAFAELIAVPAAGLHRIPPGVDAIDAAAFWVGYRTAFHALRTLAKVAPGDVVLVLGAGGGVGLASVDLATHYGGHVIAAASSSEKLEACRQRGARDVVNYRETNLREALRSIAPDGVSIVVDPVGGPYADQALRGLARGGRYVVVGFASGTIPTLAANLILLKSTRVMGLELRTFDLVDPEGSESGQRELLQLLADGVLRPHIGARFGLSEGRAALRHVADGSAIGKIVITPD